LSIELPGTPPRRYSRDIKGSPSHIVQIEYFDIETIAKDRILEGKAG
jgi:hypothetical protein